MLHKLPIQGKANLNRAGKLYSIEEFDEGFCTKSVPSGPMPYAEKTLIILKIAVTVLTLILVPLAAGLVLLCLKPDLPRKILVTGVTLAVCCGSVVLATAAHPRSICR